MASSAPCYNCAQNVADITGTAQLKRINRMISDNFTVIFLCILTIILLSWMMWFFGSKMYSVIKKWQDVRIKVDNSGNATINDDKEVYDEEAMALDGGLNAVNPDKQDFAKSMEYAYKEYNRRKSEYIQTNYTRPNDDVIDQSVFYKKYDDYTYASES